MDAVFILQIAMAMNMPSGQNNPSSPCVRHCCLDEHDVCLGCYRSLAEILAWHDMSEDEKALLMQTLAARKEAKAKAISDKRNNR